MNQEAPRARFKTFLSATVMRDSAEEDCRVVARKIDRTPQLIWPRYLARYRPFHLS